MNKATILIMVLIYFMAIRMATSSDFLDYGFTIPSNSNSDHIPIVPTNFGGLLWSPCYTCTEFNRSKSVTLYQLGDTEVKVPTFTRLWDKNKDSYLVYLISPIKELEPGALYEFRMSFMCGNKDIPFTPVRFITSQSSRYPSLLGEIKEFPQRLDSVEGGSSCSSRTVPGVEKDFELVVSPEFAPWIEAAYISVFIDDYPWHEITRVSVEDGSLKISAYYSQSCEKEIQNESKMPAQKHKIRFEAKLPNIDAVLETSTLEFEISCPSKNEIAKDKNSLPPAMGPIADANYVEGGCQSTGAGPWILIFLLMIVALKKRSLSL